MKRLSLLLIIILGIVSISAVTFSQELKDEQVLIYGVGAADIGGMDPHMAPATNDKTVVDPMFNGLVRFRPGNMNPEYIEPDLAKSWDVSDDGLVWTFYLHEGVQFHKGYGELTAEDVVFSLEKAGDPARSAFSSDYRIFEKVEAVDRHTVEITLTDPVPPVQVLGILTDYQGGMIVSKKAVEEFGQDFRMNPIGTGPFALERYRSRELVELVRHEDYFKGTPILEKIVIRFMPEVRSRELAFRTGELDIIEGLRESWWVEDMALLPDVEVDIIGPGEMRTLHFNLSREPYDDIRIRQAIAYAIDREEVCEIVGREVTDLAYSPVPPGYYASIDDVERYDHNPEKVAELLAEAGYPDGIDLGVVITTERDPLLIPLEIIHDQLARMGIDFDMQVVDHSTFHEQIRDNLSGMILYGAARFPLPDQYLTQFYHSASVVQTPTAVTNFSHYGSLLPGVDDLIEGARIEMDPVKQREMWEEAQRQIMMDLPTYPIYVLRLVFIRKNHVDLGYDFESTIALTPQFNEKTRLIQP